MENEYMTLNDIANADKQATGSIVRDDNGQELANYTLDDISQSFRFSGSNIDAIYYKQPPKFWESLGSGFADGLSFDGLARAFRPITYMGMDEDEATIKAALDAKSTWLNQQRQAINLEEKGGEYELLWGLTSADKLGSGLASILKYMGVSAIGAGIGGVRGAQVATAALTTAETYGSSMTDAEMDYVNRTGDFEFKEFDREKVNGFALANGVVQAWIENRIGLGPILNKVFGGSAKTMTKEALEAGVKKLGGKVLSKEALKAGGKAFIGEATEESLQELSDVAYGKIIGFNDDDALATFKRTLSAGVTGGLLGGVVGASAYRANVRQMTNQLKEIGLSEQNAKSLAMAITSEAEKQVVGEMYSRSMLQDRYGDLYDKLKKDIGEVIDSQGWTGTGNKDDYIDLQARDIAGQALRLADKFNIPVKDVLDLEKVNVVDNSLVLDEAYLGDEQAVLAKRKSLQEQIDTLTRMGKVSSIDTDKKRILVVRRNILDNYIFKMGFKKVQDKQKRYNKNKVQEVLEAQAPQAVQALQGIQFVNGDSVYAGDKKIPVGWKVVELESINPSHINGQKNKNYKTKELQNRLARESMVDVAELKKRANKLQPERLVWSPDLTSGAPLVNTDSDVIAGNGRYEILRNAYNQNPAGVEQYKNMLKGLGYNTAGFEKPILVRTFNGTKEEQIALADISNVSAIDDFDHASQALQDAKELQNTSDMYDWVRTLPITRQKKFELLNGTYDVQEVRNRYNDAVMAWLLGDVNEIENVLFKERIPLKLRNAIVQNIQPLIDYTKQYGDTLKNDFKAGILKATEYNTKEKISDYLRERHADFGVNPVGSNAIAVGANYSANQIEFGDFIGNILNRFIANEQNSDTGSMLLAMPKQTASDIYCDVLSKEPFVAEKREIKGNELTGEQAFKAVAISADEFAKNETVYHQEHRGRGYVGYSMSVNMAEAQANNELPASKAAKALGVSTQAIKEVLTPSAWHHASSYYNRVDVYDINPYLALKNGEELDADEYTEDEISDYKAKWEKMKNMPKPDKTVKQFYGNAEWLEWSGTKAHPKAEEHSFENILIEQKGSFYTFHLPNGNVVRKKIGSNGTHVISEEEIAERKYRDDVLHKIRELVSEVVNKYRPAFEEYRKINKLDKPDFETFKTVSVERNTFGDNYYISGQKPYSEHKDTGLRRIHREGGKYQLQEWNGNEWDVLETRDSFEPNWSSDIRDYVRSFVQEQNDEDYSRLNEAYNSYSIEEMEKAINAYEAGNNIYNQEEETTQNERDLVVQHTISKYNLERALDFGGLPVPSLAIVNKDTPFNFGGGENIQLIGNKEMIDPRYTPVYNRDIWSITFPQITYKKPAYSKVQKFEKEFKPYFDKAVDNGALGSLLYEAQRSSTSSALNNFINSTGAKLAYLERNGDNVELPEPHNAAEEKLKELGIDAQFAEEAKDLNGFELEYDELIDAYTPIMKRYLERKEYTGKFAEKRKELDQERYFDENGRIFWNKANSIAYGLAGYENAKSRKIYDSYEVRYFVNSKITDQEAYEKWATEQMQSKLLGNPMVEVGRKLMPFNIDNVVEAMTSKAVVNSQDSLVFSNGKIVAAGAKQLNSIEEIKIEGKKLVTEEQSKENMEQLNEDISTFMDAFPQPKDDMISWSFQREAIGKALAKMAQGDKPTAAKLKTALNRELDAKNDYPAELLDAGMKLVHSIKNLSRYYFEAKPQRAVDISEFSGAIVPTSKEYDEISAKLADKGLQVVRSDDSASAVKQFEDVFFQRGKAVQASYDPELKAIVLGKEYNEMSLPHEMAHYWLDKLFDMYKGGLYKDNKGFTEQIESLKSLLDISDTQDRLTTPQQEKFARMVEAVATGLAEKTQGVELIQTEYLNWVPKKYKSARSIMYMDSQGRMQMPLFDEEAKQFFDDWYGHLGLPKPMQAKFVNGDDEPAKKEVVAEREQIINEQIKEAQQAIAERNEVFDNNMPADVKAKVAAVEEEQRQGKYLEYGRHKKGIRGEVDEQASEYINTNPEHALEIALGDNRENHPNYVKNDSGIDRGRLIKAMRDNAKEPSLIVALDKKLAEYKSGAGFSLGVNADESHRLYLAGLSKISKAMREQFMLKHLGVGNKTEEKYIDIVEGIAGKYYERMLNAKDEAGIESVARIMLAELRGEFGVESQESYDSDTGILSQIDIYEFKRAKDKQKFIAYAIKFADKNLKASPDTAQEAELLVLADDAQDAESMLNSKNKAEAILAAKKIRAYQSFLEGFTEQPKVSDAIIGNWFMRFMLSNPGTHAKNIISNTIAMETVNGALVSKYGKSTVSQDKIDAEYNRLRDIYFTTGISVPQMQTTQSGTMIHGEKYKQGKTISERKGIEKLDPLMWLGREDFWFRTKVYLNALAHLATAQSKVEGETMSADKIFDELCNVRSMSPMEAEIREDKQIKTFTDIKAYTMRMEAVLTGEVATFTESGKFAQGLNGLRSVFDEVKLWRGKYGLGTLIAPFVKTPANILEQGARSLASPFTVARDVFKTGSVDLRHRIDLIYLAEAIVLFGAVAGIGGDYEPPYAEGTRYDKGKHYDSIKFGDVYIDLEAFGVAAMPLRLIFGAVNGLKGDKKAWVNTVKGQLSEIPFGAGKITYALTSEKGIQDFAVGEAGKIIPRAGQLAARETGIDLSEYSDNYMYRRALKRLGLDGTENNLNDYLKFLFGFVEYK